MAAGYRRGTLIATPDGTVAIETLSIGDRIITKQGAARRLRWVGRQRFEAAGVDDARVQPVRIAAGAFGGSLPERDLWVAPDQAILVGELLVPARRLVDGRAIVLETDTVPIEYVHLELDTHDLLLAEGMAAETFVDDGQRRIFDNALDYLLLYPDSFREAVHLCAPRLDDGAAFSPPTSLSSPSAPALPEESADPPGRVLEGFIDVANRLVVSGWVLDPVAPEEPLEIALQVGGRTLAAARADRYRADLAVAGGRSGHHAFRLPIAGLLGEVTVEITLIDTASGLVLPGMPRLIEAAAVGVASATAADGDGVAVLKAEAAPEPHASALPAAATEPTITDVKAVESIMLPKPPVPLAEAMRDALSALLTQANEDDETAALDFLTRERETLLKRRAERDSGIAARSGPGSRQRILVIDNLVPELGRDTDSAAILSHMRAMRALGYDVAFTAFAGLDDQPGIRRLRSTEDVSVYGLPYYTSVEDVLRRQAGTFDIVYMQSISNANHYLALARTYQPKARLVYSVGHLHHVRLERHAKIEARPELLGLARRMEAVEIMAARQVHAVITSSVEEAERLQTQVPRGRTHLVPFAVESRVSTTPFEARHGIAFFGRYNHAHHRDAAHWLVSEIMPAVWAMDGSIECLIVGQGWGEQRFGDRDPRLRVEEPGDDPTRILEKARLCIAPLRFGSGLQGKVLDALAAGLPCVMTPIAAEGVVLPSALRSMVADDAVGLAAAVCRLHGDVGAYAEAAAAATDLIRSDYNRAKVTAALGAVLGGQSAENATVDAIYRLGPSRTEAKDRDASSGEV